MKIKSLTLCMAIPCMMYTLLFMSCDFSDKYKIERNSVSWKWRGVDITRLNPERTRGERIISWVLEYAFTDRFIYGRTTTKWFLIDKHTKSISKFQTKKELQEVLRQHNMVFGELIQTPLFEIPDFPYGYDLLGKQIYKYNLRGIFPNLVSVGMYMEYIIGQTEASGDSNWIAINIKTDDVYFVPSLDSLCFIPEFKRGKIIENLKIIPDYLLYTFRNMLSSNEYVLGECDIGANVPCLMIWDGSVGYEVVKFIEYYKKEKGYIFGKAGREYFIFNTRNEKCLYIRDEDEWMKKLKELRLSKNYMKYTGYTPLDRLSAEMSPWRE